MAFVSRPEWGDKPPPDEEIEDAVANLLAHDLVPFLEGRYRTDPRPERRALVGTGFAGWRAAYAAFRHPTVFGALGLQSLSMLDTDQDLLEKQVRTAAEVPLRLYLDWGRYDRRGTREAWDMRRANQRFDALLRERGYRPAGGEVPEGAGVGGLAQPHRPGVRSPVPGAAPSGGGRREALTRQNTARNRMVQPGQGVDVTDQTGPQFDPARSGEYRKPREPANPDGRSGASRLRDNEPWCSDPGHLLAGDPLRVSFPNTELIASGMRGFDALHETATRLARVRLRT